MRKNTTLGLALAALVSLAAVSCKKEAAQITEFTATVEECAGDNSKVMLDGNTLRWTDGDQIAVYGSDGRGIYTTTNTGEYTTTFTFTDGDNPGDPNYTAIYPASWAVRSAVVLLPPVQTSSDGSLQEFPMMAKSSTSQLEFKNLCGALCLNLQAEGKSITAIELAYPIYEGYLCGTYSVNYNNGEPTLTAIGSGCYQEVLLSITTPQSISQAKDFYIALPPNTYGNGFTIKLYASDGSVCSKTITSGHSFTIARSSIFTITLSGSDLVFEANAGMLNGAFSVSPTKQVHFSQGNLSYTGFGTHAVADGSADGTWRFAYHQCTYTSRSGDNYTTGWIDCFPWATSGWNSGATYYQPYQTNGNYDQYGPSSLTSGDLTGSYAYADWGVYNAIINGGNQPQQWRTLTADEWDYLLNQRTGHSIKWGIARVESTWDSRIIGLILLPDSWNLPAGLDFNEGFAIGGTVLNDYTSEQWAQMEAAGAVFIPGNYYSYWTASTTSNYYATGIYISENECTLSNNYTRGSSIFVRLVKDAN